MSRRSCVRYVLVACIVWVALVVFELFRDPDRYGDMHWSRLSFATSSNKAAAYVCSSRDIVYGDWIGGRSFDSVQDVREGYNLASNANIKCPPIKPIGSTTEPTEEQIFERLNLVASPMLVPRSGCPIHDMDHRAIIKRLLRSPMGLTIVGDSISGHHYAVWQGILGLTPSLLISNYRELRLNPAHPEAANLLAEAGVPSSRLEYPLVTAFRHDHLVDEEELATVVGDKFNFNPWLQTPDWYPGWRQALDEASKIDIPIEVLEPSVVLLNQGAHWKATELGEATDDELVESYERLFATISRKMREIPHPVTTIWRSLTPYHVDCGESREYNNSKTDFASPITGAAYLDRTNVHLFERMNALVESKTIYDRPPASWDYIGTSSIDNNAHVNPPLRFMDVWPMSIKRPEAHLGPVKDCLHWCMVGLMNYWSQLLWNMLLEESRNQDYL